MNRIRSFAAVITAASILMSSYAYAGRTIALRIVNKEAVNISFTILKKGHNCYEPYPEGLVSTSIDLKPNANYMWKFNRVQGHGCDGENGVFQVQFSWPEKANEEANGKVIKDIASFTYDNGSHLQMDSTVANPYPGTLTEQSPSWYLYETAGLIKSITSSSAVGYWKRVCDGVCNHSSTKATAIETTSVKTLSHEEKSAISMSLTAGVKAKIYSSEFKITKSQERSIGTSMSTSFMNGETNTDASAYVFSPEQMRTMNIQAVWQWVVPIALSDGKNVLIRSKLYTCTSTSEAPTYYAQDSLSKGSCSGTLAKPLI